MFPAESRAVIVMLVGSGVRGMVADQASVPVAVPVPPDAALDQVTAARETSSDAVPKGGCQRPRC